ncbi:MAG: hypothetical protein C0443_01410 [Comamonadaceae bacterium]|nr:hypothetical protein [Comamonadaceae bacterium]
METPAPSVPGPRLVSRDTSAACPAHASLAELLHMFGAKVADLAAGAHIPVLLRRMSAGEGLVHEGAPADAIFFVRSGTFKVFRTDEDGYEQVLAFAVRSELLGFDALCMESYPTAMQALEDSTVYVIPRREIGLLSQALPTFALVLQQAGSLTLTRSRELVDIMAAVASDVRLARFLIQLSRRMLACGQSPRRFLLRMGRREIASLLGVAHETVSRCFSALAAMGLLHVNDREVEILDMDGLKAFSRSTRRPVDDAALARNQHLPIIARATTGRHSARRTQ